MIFKFRFLEKTFLAKNIFYFFKEGSKSGLDQVHETLMKKR